MKYSYIAYTKLIDNKIHYFVKKFMTFPEYDAVGDVQVGYGMHTNFEIACNICGIYDSTRSKQLLIELEQRNRPIIPNRLPIIQVSRLQRSGVKHPVQISGMVKRRLVETGAETLN